MIVTSGLGSDLLVTQGLGLTGKRAAPDQAFYSFRYGDREWRFRTPQEAATFMATEGWRVQIPTVGALDLEPSDLGTGLPAMASFMFDARQQLEDQLARLDQLQRETDRADQEERAAVVRGARKKYKAALDAVARAQAEIDKTVRKRAEEEAVLALILADAL